MPDDLPILEVLLKRGKAGGRSVPWPVRLWVEPAIWPNDSSNRVTEPTIIKKAGDFAATPAYDRNPFMPSTKRFVCIHGHFYQPPRENPWLETVETQDSAAPYHDCARAGSTW